MYCCPRTPGLSEFWIQKMDKYFAIHCIVEALARKSGVETPIITSVILSLYILSGCDTVSFQYKKGKKIVLKISLEMVHKLYLLGKCAEPGERLAVAENIIQAAGQLFLGLYGRSDFTGTLDDLRAHLFATTKWDLRCLPPTEDAFKFHVLRSLYQISVSKSAHCSAPQYLDPTMFGRKIQDGKLVPIMMTTPAKPNKASRPKYCRCRKTRCLTHHCICAKAGVKCVVACLCTADPTKCVRTQTALAEVDSD